MAKLDSVLKSKYITLLTKVHIVKAMVFPAAIYNKSWTIKKADWRRIYAFGINCGVGKMLESPLDCKEIKPVNLKGNQPWIFIGRTDAEALILWRPDANS